jgi:hypothetical protein
MHMSIIYYLYTTWLLSSILKIFRHNRYNIIIMCWRKRVLCFRWTVCISEQARLTHLLLFLSSSPIGLYICMTFCTWTVVLPFYYHDETCVFTRSEMCTIKLCKQPYVCVKWIAYLALNYVLQSSMIDI